MTMEQTDFSTDWEATSARLLKEYPQLTGEDLAYEIGKEGELLKRLEEKTGKTEKDIKDWLRIMG